MASSSFKISVLFEPRPDGGLRAWSEDVPGLILSHSDPDAVIADVREALQVILSHKFETEVEVEPLLDIRDALESHDIVKPKNSVPPRHQDYVAYRH